MNLNFVKNFPDGPFLRDGSHILNSNYSNNTMLDWEEKKKKIAKFLKKIFKK